MAGLSIAPDERLIDRFSPRTRAWPLLFPITYIVHIAEEYWGGEGFHNWLSRMAGANLTAERFLILNMLGWFVMFGLCLLAVVRFPRLRGIPVAFGTVVLLNGIAHVAATAITLTYSPGLLSSLLLWVPLGTMTLRQMYSTTARKHFALAVAFGLILHAIVTVTALGW